MGVSDPATYLLRALGENRPDPDAVRTSPCKGPYDGTWDIVVMGFVLRHGEAGHGGTTATLTSLIRSHSR